MRESLRTALLKGLIGAVAGGISALVIAALFPAVVAGFGLADFVLAASIGGFVATVTQAILESVLRL